MSKERFLPRKHRKHALELTNEFKHGLGKNDNYYTNFDEFLQYKMIGINDGWMRSSYKEYEALKWLVGIDELLYELHWWDR